MVVATKIFRRGTFFRNPLYNPTPSSDAIEVTSFTRPRNSGVKPSLLVLCKMENVIMGSISRDNKLEGKLTLNPYVK